MYDELARYLRQYLAQTHCQFTDSEFQGLYRLLGMVIDQSKPVFKYEEKDGLNKESGKRTIALVNILLEILLDKYPHISISASTYIKNYINLE